MSGTLVHRCKSGLPWSEDTSKSSDASESIRAWRGRGHPAGQPLADASRGADQRTSRGPERIHDDQAVTGAVGQVPGAGRAGQSLI